MTFRYLGSQIKIDTLTAWYTRWRKRASVLQKHYCNKVSIEYEKFLPDHPNENLRWEYFLESSWWAMFYRSYILLMTDHCHFNDYMIKLGITLEPYHPLRSGSIIPTTFEQRSNYEICYHYLKPPPSVNEVRNLLIIYHSS